MVLQVATGQFTDDSFGQQRQAAGIDTRWHIRPPNNTRIIRIDFAFNRTFFRTYSDAVDVFEGSEDMKGDRVASITYVRNRFRFDDMSFSRADWCLLPLASVVVCGCFGAGAYWFHWQSEPVLQVL